MDPRYIAWISQRYPDQDSAHHQCSFASRLMIERFPELRLVRGLYRSSKGNTQHWWCETKEGEKVDPTLIQFEDQQGTYEEYKGPDPKGKCMECGEYCWDEDSFCCLECMQSFCRGEGYPLWVGSKLRKREDVRLPEGAWAL